MYCVCSIYRARSQPGDTAGTLGILSVSLTVLTVFSLRWTAFVETARSFSTHQPTPGTNGTMYTRNMRTMVGTATAGDTTEVGARSIQTNVLFSVYRWVLRIPLSIPLPFLRAVLSVVITSTIIHDSDTNDIASSMSATDRREVAGGWTRGLKPNKIVGTLWER